jgi:enhancer of polycomb-like protein
MRPRQIDFNKPLAILREDRDINVTTSDFFTVPKGGINTTTGMEKEEESEHHLQQILNSSCQQRSATIPVPEVIEDLAEFEATYAGGFKLSSHFITHQTLEPSDEKEIDYDMDSADEAWLSSSDSSISTEIFETLMDCFEKACGKKVPLLKEALSLVKACTSIGTEAAIAVYDYWLEKRSFQPEGFLYVVNDGQEPVGNADPYVAFRRRSEKMQTRRHRRSDELSYEKMFLFHQSLLHLKSLTYDIYLRDSAKKLQAEKSYEIDQLRLKCPDITSDVYKKCLRDASTVQVDSKAFFKSLRQRPENEVS